MTADEADADYRHDAMDMQEYEAKLQAVEIAKVIGGMFRG